VLYGLFDFETAFKEQKTVTVGLQELFPQGLPPAMLPAQDNEVQIQLAFTQSRISAYTTTELWSGYSAVWLQPMYFLVTEWNPAAPLKKKLPDSKPIFSVGPKSRFYSPYWRVYYVVVPPGTAADKYTQSRQLFEDRLPVHEGPGRLCALGPDGIRLGRPLLPDVVVGKPGVGTGYVDGDSKPIAVMDFGINRFTWNERLEVNAEPLFHFVTASGSGWAPTFAPAVGGTGPLFARRPAIFPDRRPYFGSFWQIYTVRLPVAAGVFLPSDTEFKDLSDRVASMVRPPERTLADYEAPPAQTTDAGPPPPSAPRNFRDRVGRVALDASCFDRDVATCVWLDSQQALEENIPSRLIPTSIYANCPFVTYAGGPVPTEPPSGSPKP
jgi:hypothetical protein